MNATAYAQVEAHWPFILESLRAATGPSAADAFRATCRLRWLALALPAPLEVPVAATFKTALGLNRPLTSWLLLAPGAASRPLQELVSSAELLERLDREGWLLGSRQVCAGPPGRIREAWDALSDPRDADTLPADALAVADRATDLVVSLWAILGATREALRAGHGEEAPTWSPVGPVSEDWPQVLRLLRMEGPGALVREVPRFEPEWALHVYDRPPAPVEDAVRGARDALARPTPLAALDVVWDACVRQLHPE